MRTTPLTIAAATATTTTATVQAKLDTAEVQAAASKEATATLQAEVCYHKQSVSQLEGALQTVQVTLSCN
jgi:crotonobetainyl-CoA:carnitine CoA-transferase CaiB-like acyl-CoA transferase